MKKWIAGILCAVGLFLVACSGSDGQMEDGVYEPEIELDYYTDYDEHPNARFLEDVDYLFYILENNFPLFNAAERSLGIDVAEIKATTRFTIENVTTINDTHFQQRLQNLFFSHFNSFGHLFMIDDNLFHSFLQPHGLQPWMEILDNPASHHFYGDPPPRHQGQGGMGIFYNPDNVLTETLGEGRIAYIAIRTFWHENINPDSDIILEFLQSVAHYNHLILDIRGNGGGSSTYWTHIIMPLLLNQPVTAYFYNFTMDGQHLRRFYSDTSPDFADFTPVYDGLLEGFPLLHPDDAGLFEYYFRLAIPIEPHPEFAVGFNGKIWLLVDEYNFSAAETATQITQQTNFATIVGVSTGGGGGRTPIVAVMPNSGIAVYFQAVYGIDHLGRNGYEFSAQPDIFNRDGMDALATVLAIIEEGDY
ncbi:MAG: S41 family peptidase [Defluviitaleaceae bacterium]|nr:S41 family peptidase [Defluviitaleaceae bacterium]